MSIYVEISFDAVKKVRGNCNNIEVEKIINFLKGCGKFYLPRGKFWKYEGNLIFDLLP